MEKEPTNSETSAYPCNSLLTNSGLTKREYFAGLAMQSMISYQADNLYQSKENCIKKSIAHADELLKQLNNPQTT